MEIQLIPKAKMNEEVKKKPTTTDNKQTKTKQVIDSFKDVDITEKKEVAAMGKGRWPRTGQRCVMKKESSELQHEEFSEQSVLGRLK